MPAAKLPVTSALACLLALKAGASHSGGPAADCAADDLQCSAGSFVAGGGLTRQAARAAAGGDHVLLQRGTFAHKTSSRSGHGDGQDCTPENQNPWASGLQCCGGLIRRWQWSSFRFTCVKSGSCTPEGSDPWITGDKIQCCEGLTAIPEWLSDGSSSYHCRAPATNATTAGPSAESPLEINLLNWNVHWTNKDVQGIADIVKETSPDVVGLCELTVSLDDMAAALSLKTGRRFAKQPGRGGWQGYGTDIFYDQDKWEALDGGVQKVSCPGGRGGDRAANWAVLRHQACGKLIITGGIHLSYCAEGCDSTHECELGMLYDNIDRMRSQYPDAAVVWMGDTNRDMSTRIMRNLMQGKIGGRATIALDDLAQTQGNTYYTGGTAIDHVLGEAGKFERLTGGRTGQGVTGQHLNGADHFPVRAVVHYGR